MKFASPRFPAAYLNNKRQLPKTKNGISNTDIIPRAINLLPILKNIINNDKRTTIKKRIIPLIARSEIAK